MTRLIDRREEIGDVAENSEQVVKMLWRTANKLLSLRLYQSQRYQSKLILKLKYNYATYSVFILEVYLLHMSYKIRERIITIVK